MDRIAIGRDQLQSEAEPARSGRSARRRVPALVALSALVAAFVPMVPHADAAPAPGPTTTAAFTAGGTVVANGTRYAKKDQSLTLTVTTPSDTKCVEGAGLTRQTSSSGKSTWTFNVLAPAGDNVQTFTASTGTGSNANGCTGHSTSGSASYTLDNTSPVVTGTLSPNPNAAGWNKSNVTIAWRATDAGSGVTSGPTPASDSETSDATTTAGVTKTATSTDAVGNVGNGSVIVKLDKTAPGITVSHVPAANAAGWNNTDVTVGFNCTDNLSGIKTCLKPTTTFTQNAANQSVTATATDNADNEASRTETVNIDKIAPTLSGAPTTSANGASWYKGDVAIAWTCNDALSGIAAAACPSNASITSEGTGLTVSASVTDRAGNPANATSSAVNIDRTAPVTTASAPPEWNKTDVTVSLSATDSLSQVADTFFILDAGAARTYDASAGIAIDTEGTHTLTFWSTDRAGNEEAHKTAKVRIDKSSPTISHTQSPPANARSWNNGDVTVRFVCNDSVSGIKDCTPDKTFTAEGTALTILGTATDNAGNSVSDPSVLVNIDKTAPTVTATRMPAANSASWNRTDVTTTFECADSRSGVLSCPEPVILGEGADQSASGTGTDNADNTATAGVTGVNVDKTAPTISGAVVTPADGSGWHRGDVVVHWTCGDALSGLAGATTEAPCPLADTVVTGEGSNLSASASVTDRAGNTASATVSGIRIDRTAPVTSTTAPRGWVKDDVTLTLASSDSLSGPATTHYTVDGRAEQTGTSVSITTNGSHTVSIWSVDAAGNAEAPHAVEVKLDKAPPTITYNQSPAANTNGWTNTAVAVTFNCEDQETLSGVASCTASRILAEEGSSQTVPGRATDNAGNEAFDLAMVSIDMTAPTISAAADRAANDNGWYKDDVVVGFICGDALSGVDTCPRAMTLAEGEDQSVTRSVSDLAGNTASATVGDIDVDKTPPVLSGAATTSPIGGWHRADVSIEWSCSDALSGLAAKACPSNSTISGEGEGLTTLVSLADRAGNEVTRSSAPVSIDRTAPATTISAPAGWTNDSATVTLTAHDGLSGVAATSYRLDGGDEKAYDAATGIVIAEEGDHTVVYRSTDVAGNTEAATTANVKIDKSAPTIGHTLDPAANGAGWNNQASVTVTFTCADQAGLSGIRSCTTPHTVTAEGKGHEAKGTAVDNAGNSQSHTATVNVDRTSPTISATADRADNGAGWYADDVTVTFTCFDPTPADDVDPSGVNTCTGPAILAEGADQSAAGSVTDVAGNTAATTKSGINVDKTRPILTGSPSEANGAGWYNADATITWDCSDNLSGIPADTCPAPSTLAGEGSNLSATSTVHDAAGNATTTTVGGLKIDRSAPVTETDAPTGWSSTAVTVNFTAFDGLSGVASTHFSVDGGTAQNGSSVVIGDEGDHTLRFWSVDVAGNSEAAHAVQVKVDSTIPTIGHTHVPAANANRWNNSDVTVTFTCDDKLSGVARCEGSGTVTTEGAGQSVAGRAVDNAGNSAVDAGTVNLDKTAPTISGAADRRANDAGWHADDVTVSFNCIDTLSGVATCPGAKQLGEGRDQSASGSAVDAAGNRAGATVAGINVDKTVPDLAGSPTTAANGAGWHNAPVTVRWTCDDELSGIAAGACPGDAAISGEGRGLRSEGSVSDVAGNRRTASSKPVDVDWTAPATAASAPSAWVDTAVTVRLSPTDNLSGVDATHYQLDGGEPETGTEVAITTEGTHTLEYWSVDTAGNTEAHNTVTVKIDKSNPTITHTQSPSANEAGWNKAAVTVTFSCADQDNLSGIASCTKPQTVTTEGQNQSVPGVAIDNAGNRADDPATVSIDSTKPTISGSTERAANGAGWHNAPVAVSFTCADNLSGVAGACGPARTVAADGASQSVSGTVADAAGNTAGTVLGGINVDTTPPTISGTFDRGWHNGDVTVTWACEDSLSGIAEGACPAPSTVIGEGETLSSTRSVADSAGNSRSSTAGGIKIDRTAPTTTSDAPTGWKNAGVTVKLTATDALSGVSTTRYTLDGGDEQAYGAGGIGIAGEGVHTLAFWSVDNAGNAEAPRTATVSIDLTRPAITGAVTSSANAAGWHRAPVSVHFTCTDAGGSGIASCLSPEVIVSSNGTGRSAQATAADHAGNTAAATVGGLNIDTVEPVISSVNVDRQTYRLGSVPAPSCTATDDTSQVDASGCRVSVTGGTPSGVGTFKWSATATDVAGNTRTTTGTYTVEYGFGTTFYLQPLNDTVRQSGMSTSVFKSGSTVPVKFQLKKADGTTVQATDAPVFAAPVQVGTNAAAVNETSPSVAPDAGGTFRWDATAQQYIYNWKTPSKPGTNWRLQVNLDDGKHYDVSIGLK